MDFYNIFAPYELYDESNILHYAIVSVCLTNAGIKCMRIPITSHLPAPSCSSAGDKDKQFPEPIRLHFVWLDLLKAANLFSPTAMVPLG